MHEEGEASGHVGGKEEGAKACAWQGVKRELGLAGKERRSYLGCVRVCYLGSKKWVEHWALGLAQIGYWVLGPTTKRIR